MTLIIKKVRQDSVMRINYIIYTVVVDSFSSGQEALW